MKSSKEIADYVFKARDEYLEKKKKRNLFIGRITSFGTIGAAVAAVLICSFNLLPKIEENKIDVIPDTTYTTVSTIKPEDNTSDDTDNTENTKNTDSTDLSEDNQTQPQQTDIATVIKPVLTAPPSVSGSPTVSGSAQDGAPAVTTTQPYVTSIIVVTQTNGYEDTPESFVTSIVTVPAAPTTSTMIAASPAPNGSHTKITTKATTTRVTTKTTTSKTQTVTVAVTSATTELVPNTTTRLTSVSDSVNTAVTVTEAMTQIAPVTQTTTTNWWPEGWEPGDSIHQNSGTADPSVTQGWNDDTIRENLDYIVLNGVGYSMTGSTVTQSEVSSRLYTCGVDTTNPDYGSPCILTANVYQITGLEPPKYVAVRFGSTNGVYYVYKMT